MLSLHHLTALDASPTELVGLAAGNGCQAVSLFVHLPAAHRHRYPMVAPEAVPALAAELAARQVGVAALEVFALDGQPFPDEIMEALFIGARLGARLATVHIHIADEVRAAEQFQAFAELAATYGVAALLEFNPFSAVADLAAAHRIAGQAGTGGIALDCLHFARSGGDQVALAAAAPLVRYVQLCDGPVDCPADARWREAIGDRLRPGEGTFPLQQWLDGLSTDLIIDVEVPQAPAMQAGVPAADRVARAVAAARMVLAGR